MQPHYLYDICDQCKKNHNITYTKQFLSTVKNKNHNFLKRIEKTHQKTLINKQLTKN